MRTEYKEIIDSKLGSSGLEKDASAWSVYDRIRSIREILLALKEEDKTVKFDKEIIEHIVYTVTYNMGLSKEKTIKFEGWVIKYIVYFIKQIFINVSKKTDVQTEEVLETTDSVHINPEECKGMESDKDYLKELGWNNPDGK